MKFAALIAFTTFAVAGCGGTGSSSDVLNCTGTNTAQYVADSLTVPPTNRDYAIDLNGDTRKDNQLGNIMSILSANKLDTQGGIDKSVMNGELVLLFSETASDATFTNESCAGATLAVGKPTASAPDFTTVQTFELDPNVSSGAFFGKIAAGKFSSNSPVTTTNPVTVSIKIPLVSSADPVELTISGAHIQFARGSDGKLSGGEIHGAIKIDDVQLKIIPNVASLLNDRVMKAPTDSNNKQIVTLFDAGGTADPAHPECGSTCKNPNVGNRPNECAAAMDGIIDTCEVATNSLIKSVLGPDVQMYDDAGHYAPNKANTHKDSLSIGIGFTAVPAKF